MTAFARIDVESGGRHSLKAHYSSDLVGRDSVEPLVKERRVGAAVYLGRRF
jgi:hypothetical protein